MLGGLHSSAAGANGWRQGFRSVATLGVLVSPVQETEPVPYDLVWSTSGGGILIRNYGTDHPALLASGSTVPCDWIAPAVMPAGLSEERLPGYAPDLNPLEMLWGNLKGQELANRSSANLAGAPAAVNLGMTRVRHSPQLAFAFLDHAGLSF
jgi:hypothetical protein